MIFRPPKAGRMLQVERWSASTTNQLLNWTARQDTPLHYSIPIYATNDPIQLDFRFKVNTTAGDALLWVGLANELNELSPGVGAADLAGTFLGIDSANKIQFLNLSPDQTYSRVDGTASTLQYGGNSVWRRAILSIDGTSWDLVVKDDNGTEVGQYVRRAAPTPGPLQVPCSDV